MDAKTHEPPTFDEQLNTFGKKSSIVWQYFTVETVGGGSTRARCKMCQKLLAYSKKIGSSNLRRHIVLGSCPGIKNCPPKECHAASPELMSIPYYQDYSSDEIANVGEKRKAISEEEQECADGLKVTTTEPTVFETSPTSEKQPEGGVTVCGSHDPEPKTMQSTNPAPPTEAETSARTPALNCSLPASRGESSMSAKPPLSVQITSRNLIEELSSRTSTQRSTGEISTSRQTPFSDFLRQQREELSGFLNMSLEDINQANDFDNVEKVVHMLVQHTTDYLDWTTLEALESRLAEFKERIPSTIAALESDQTHKDSLQIKAGDLDTRLVQMQEQLGSLEAEVSKLSEEETKLEAEIQRLIAQKEEVHALKNLTILQLEKINQETTKGLEEWKNQEDELKQASKNWVKGKEWLAQANTSWRLFRDLLGL